jgi:MOSC domain-containing protein YiiM
MKLLSVNVGQPRLVMAGENIVTTSIFKEPIKGRVGLRKHNLEGDRQSDLTVHGGRTKAVYVYSSEHYGFWRDELPEMDLPFGMFGENFTTEGLHEKEAFIGDRYRIGTAEVMVTEPRMPCFKLGVKFGRKDIIKRFMQSRRAGFYLSVEKEGEVGAGDEFELLARDETSVTIADIVRIYAFEKDDVETLERAIKSEALPDGWKKDFESRLNRLNTV